MRYCWLALSGFLLASPALAAQLYVQPVASLQAEYDSNVTLDPNSHVVNDVYVVDAATYLGIATPDSDTNIRPRIHYEEYPNERILNQLEGILDFNTTYTGSRSKLYVFGRYDHLNETDAEIQSAQFNDVNPVSPTNPSTGFVTIGVTRDNAFVAPKYSYNLTPLVQIGASGTLQDLTYSRTNSSDLVDFHYYQAQLFVGRSLGPRTSFSIAAYGGRYQATSLDSNATTEGAQGEFDFRPSQLTTGSLSIEYQHAVVDAQQPTIVRGVGNTWGANYRQVWQLRAGQFQLQIGRTISPSGGGGLYVDQQLQGEYDRNLSDRLTVTVALLLLNSHSLSPNIGRFNRNYENSLLSIKWLMTRTWFVQGGAGYAWQKYSTTTGATNDQVFVRFGYQGLPRQQ